MSPEVHPDEPSLESVRADSSVALGMQRAARLLALVALAIAGASLLGWWLHIEVLTHFGASHATMKANTSVAVTSIALALLASLRRSGRHRRFAPMCGWFAVAIAAASLIQDLAGFDLGIDRLLSPQQHIEPGAPGRMAVGTAVELMLFGATAATLDKRIGRHYPASWMALTGAALSLIALAGYLYRADALYQVAGFTSKSLPTTLACAALAIALLLVRPRHEFMALLASPSLTGSSARRMLPTLLLVPLTLGWLCLQGRALGWYGTEMGVAILSVGSATSLFVLMLLNTRGLLRLEHVRSALQTRVDRQRAELGAELRFRRLITRAPAGMFESDAAGKCVFVNDQWTAITGMAPAAALGDGWGASLHPEDRQRVLAEWARATHEQLPIALAYRYQQPNGASVWVELESVGIRDARGTLTGFLGVVLDVSARHAAVAALERSEANFRAVVEHAPLAFIVLRERRLLYLNPVAVRLLGYDHAGELLGRDYVRMIHPDDSDASAARHDGAVAGQTLLPRSTRIRTRDGSYISVQGVPTPITFDGEPALGAVLHDVTATVRADAERRRVADALARSETNFRALVEASPFGVLVHRDGQVAYVSSALLKMLGRGAKEVLHTQLLDTVVHPDDRARVASVIASRARGCDEPMGRIRCVRADGAVLVLECSSVSVEFDGAEARADVLVDVTERERIDDVRIVAEAKVRASLAEKEILLKEVHHRVKNNLQVIGSLISLQAAGIEDVTARAAFAEMRGRVKTIASIHERIYRSPDLDRIDVRAYLDELVRDVGRALAQPGGEIETDVIAEPIALTLDALVPLGLLVNEAVTNAFKHGFPTGVRDRGTVVVTLRSVGSDLELQIRDDGVGMPTDSDPDGADSLGMSLIRGLAEQLGGAARYVSDGGTSCTVRFPQPEERPS